MAKVIAVYNKKGGCGKTTTATTLAYLLARCGKRTALIDLDSQGDSSLAYGVPNPDKLQTTILSLVKQVIIGEPLPSPSSYMYSYHGVDLVPSNEEISTLERNLSNVDFREYILKEYISQISPSYDYIIIDCMPNFDTSMLNVMVCADSVVIPTQAEYYSAIGSMKFIRNFQQIRQHANPKLEIAGILITMNQGTVKEDQTFHDSKAHTETVTVTTSSDSLAAILEQLAPTMEYSKDGYSGVLTLDHTTLQTEAAGYTTKYYTITDTKQFTGLPRNDPSYVPTTTVKDGKTLSLSNISWAVTGTGLADDTLVPTSYTATATYQATGSRSAATGYITTATYTGEITSEGIGSVQYTVTYLGTQLKSGFSIGLPLLVLLAAGLAMLAAILAFLYLRRPNAAIYAMNAKGVAYKKLGRQRIAVRNPKLDFTKLKEYPAGDSSVELKNKLARKLAGRLISIRLYDGVRTHLVEPIDGNETENYWFAVKDEDKEGSEL